MQSSATAQRGRGLSQRTLSSNRLHHTEEQSKCQPHHLLYHARQTHNRLLDGSAHSYKQNSFAAGRLHKLCSAAVFAPTTARARGGMAQLSSPIDVMPVSSSIVSNSGQDSGASQWKPVMPQTVRMLVASLTSMHRTGHSCPAWA